MKCSLLICLLLTVLVHPLHLGAQTLQPYDKRLKTLKQDLQSAVGIDRVDILLKIAPFYTNRTGNAKSNLDSAASFSKEALDLSRKLNYKRGITENSFLLGKSYIKSSRQQELEDLMKSCDEDTWARLVIEGVKQETIVFARGGSSVYDSLITLVKRAIDIGEHSGNPEIASMSLLQYSSLFYGLHDHINGRKFFEQALSKARAASDLESEAAIFFQASGHIYNDRSLYQDVMAIGEKIKTAYSALRVDQYKADIETLLVMGYDQMAYYEISQANLHAALAISLESVAMLEKSGNANLNQHPYMTIGKIYLETGDFEKCIEYLRIARAIAWRNGSVFYPVGVRHAVRAYIALNQIDKGLQFITETVAHGGYDDGRSKKLIAECFANCYFALGQYEMAEKYYLDAYAIQKRSSNVLNDGLLSLHIPIARLYVQTRQYSKAEEYLSTLLEDAYKHFVPVNVRRDAYYMLFRIDSVLGRSDRAMRSLYAYQSLNDSLFNERKNKQIEELTVKYETVKKDQDLDILRKQTDLQEADLKNAALYRNGLIGGTVILIAFLGLGYSRYRLKQKATRLLETSQTRISQSNLELHKLNEQLQKLLGEKEWLVKEIHHRVKNNLQIVSSLLRTQASHLDEGDALTAINDSQLRMQVISLLHQKLYKVDTESTVDMKMYIPDLVACIQESSNDGHINFNVNVDEIRLDISQAVPVGLILNEAITNAIKYAYPKGHRGMVVVHLLKYGVKSLVLRVIDEGQGLPADFDIHSLSSLGMKLIDTLAEQLEGKLDFISSSGTTVEITFPMRQVTHQHEDLQIVAGN